MEQKQIFKKTRIAPTPSGYLHLGNILSFAVTAALARKTHAKIMLRIDDFDMERTNKLYLQDIFDTLNFLEIPWDEGPRNLKEYETGYSQRQRMGMYHDALQQLKDGGHLFACTCSRARVLSGGPDKGYPGTCRNSNIPLETENTSWRINTADPKQLHVRTLPGTKTTTLPAAMQDFIVRRKDHLPAYQLISVIDDLHFGIDLVVRGEDLWSSTLAQQYLALVLKKDSFANLTFYHHPLIVGPDGNKLSKSEGATSVYHLRMAHKKPSDIYSLIGQTLNVKGRIESWEDLAANLNLAF